MKSSSRWLLIFGAIIGLLVIITIVLVLILPGGNSTALLPAGTPEGTVQRFFLAIKDRDFQAAYNYLSKDIQSRIPFSQWTASYTPRSDVYDWQVIMGTPVIKGNYATIVVTIDTLRPGGPFSNPISNNNVTFSLNEQNNQWIITDPDYLWRIFY